MIQPWDSTLLKAIEKAIQTSDLGINPQNDGKVIRLAFPQLTEERRKELTKQVKKYGENGKVAIRNIRRDAMEKFKSMEKKSEITEDDRKDYEKELQDMTEKRCKQIDELTAGAGRLDVPHRNFMGPGRINYVILKNERERGGTGGF